MPRAYDSFSLDFLILALRLLYLRFAPEKLKRFISDASSTAISYFKSTKEAFIQLINSIKENNKTRVPTQNVLVRGA